MALEDNKKIEWGNYITSLKQLGWRKGERGDKITWEGTKMEQQISTKESYKLLMDTILGYEPDCWFKLMWKVKVSIKMIILI